MIVGFRMWSIMVVLLTKKKGIPAMDYDKVD